MADDASSGYEEIGGLKPHDQAIVVYSKDTECTGIQGYLHLPPECNVGNDESYFNFYLGIGLETEAGISFTKKDHPMKKPQTGYWKFFINPGDNIYLGQYDEIRGRTYHLKLVINSNGRTSVWLDYNQQLDGHAASGGNHGPAKTSMALADPFGKVWYHPASFSDLKLRFGYDGSDWRDWAATGEADVVVKRHLDTRLAATSIFPLGTLCYATVEQRESHEAHEARHVGPDVERPTPISHERIKHGDLTGQAHRYPGVLGLGATGV